MEDDTSTSAYDDLPSQAWVLQVKEMAAESHEHVRNILRYASATGTIGTETLAELLDMVDNFVIPVAGAEEKTEAAFGRATSAFSTSSEEDDLLDGGSGSGSGTEDDVENDLGGGIVPSRGERMRVVARTMEHPLQGVKVGRQRYRFSTFNDVFTGADAVAWILSRGYATTREAALKLGRQLLAAGHFVHVTGTRQLEDKAHQFYRFAKHPAPLVMPQLNVPAQCMMIESALLRLVYAVHDDTVPKWLESATPEHLRVAFPAVLLWARANVSSSQVVTSRLADMARDDRSLKLMLWGFHRANGMKCIAQNGVCDAAMRPSPEEEATMRLVDSPPPSTSAKRFEKERTRVQHPFTNATTYVKYEREFTSAAKPTWVSFRDEAGERVLPDAVAKCGDDLRKDLAVQLIFQAAAAFWKAAPAMWRCGQAPTVGTFGVVATGDNAGYLEFVKGRTVKDVAAAKEWKDVNLRKLAPTVVGSLMSGFVLGVRDRHSENFMLLGDPKEDPRLIQIDFGYMLMEAPGGLALDTPRLTLQPQLIRLLRAAPGHDDKHSLLEDIQHDLITAYRVLRQHYAAFSSFARVVLSNIYPPAKIMSHLWGVHAFRAGQSEAQALRWVEDKVMTQLTERNLRRGAKHAIVKFYYGMKSVV